jgi:S-adenosylmethionine synthetase
VINNFCFVFEVLLQYGANIAILIKNKPTILVHFINIQLNYVSHVYFQDNTIQGNYHWSGGDNMTKYDMAVTMATVFNLPTNHIQADKVAPSGGGALRPFDSHLSCARLEALGIGRRTQFKDAIRDVLSPYFTP